MISNYVATYKYAVFTNRTKRQMEKYVEKMLLNKVAIFAIDSSSYLYIGSDKKVIGVPFKVNYRYGCFQADIEIDNEFFDSLPDFFQIYISNSSGVLMYERNLAPGNIDNDYILLLLSSIVLYFNGKRVVAYPTIKLYKSGIIMVEFSIYSSEDEVEECELIDFIIDVRIAMYDRIQMTKHLLKYKGFECKNEEVILSDGISERFGDYKGESISSLKDLSIFLVSEIIDESETFIAHHNFSIDGDKVDNNCIQALMNGIPYEATKTFKKVEYFNYREFEKSYKHYIHSGITVTLGDIEETRIPSLVIDELFLFMAAKVYQLRNKINSGKKSIDEILELYNTVINIKGYLLNGLNAYSFSKRIFNDLFNEYRMYEQIDNIKELIEVEIKKLEVKKNKRETSTQNLITVVLTLLSSEALMTYFVRPMYIKYKNIEISELNIYENMLMFLVPLVILLLVLAIVAMVKLIKKSIDKFR